MQRHHPLLLGIIGSLMAASRLGPVKLPPGPRPSGAPAPGAKKNTAGQFRARALTRGAEGDRAMTAAEAKRERRRERNRRVNGLDAEAPAERPLQAGDAVTWTHTVRGGCTRQVPARVVKVTDTRVIIDAELEAGGTKRAIVTPAKVARA